MPRESEAFRSDANTHSGHRRHSCVGNATVTMRFVWKYPRLVPAVPKMPTLLDEAERAGKTKTKRALQKVRDSD
jgi:hypothetical protein